MWNHICQILTIIHLVLDESTTRVYEKIAIMGIGNMLSMIYIPLQLIVILNLVLTFLD